MRGMLFLFFPADKTSADPTPFALYFFFETRYALITAYPIGLPFCSEDPAHIFIPQPCLADCVQSAAFFIPGS